MKTRILALTAIAVLASTAVAVAETNVFNTTTKDGAKVSFKIKTNKKGVAVKAVGITVKDLPVECLGDELTADGKLSASLRDAKVVAAKNNVGKTFYRFIREQQVGDKKWHVSGTVDKKGRKLQLGGASVQYKKAGVDCQPSGDTILKNVRRKK